MASITSLSNSSYSSSIYGNRNVLSGLASGMDTESMIENAISGIKLKIQNLYKKRTKVQWQQEAYRSIIDKAVNFNTNYTSYTSKTNLLSPSFFNNAVITTTNGTFANKITATGKTSSDIKINAVKQMATAASYRVSGLGGALKGAVGGITGGEFDIAGTTDVSSISGSVTFQYGGTNGTTFDINFGELEDLRDMPGSTPAEQLANAINKKLGDISYTYSKNGYQENTTAGRAIVAYANSDGTISFRDGLGNGNKITISSASGKFKNYFGIGNDDEQTTLDASNLDLVTPTATTAYLTGKSLGITYNGTTKNINMSKVISSARINSDDDETTKNEKFAAALQKELDSAFGAGKISVAWNGEGEGLTFTPQGEGNTLSLGGTAVEALGFSSGDSNFFNATKKLSDLLGDQADGIFTQANRLRGAGGAIQQTSASGDTYYLDYAGNRVDEDGYRVDENGRAIYDFQINDAHISVTEDTTLESLMSAINSNADAGVKVSYSPLTNEFQFTASQTGANGKIEFGGLGKALFGTSGSSSDKFSDAYDFGVEAGEKKWIHFYADGKEFTSFSIGDGGLLSADATIEDIIKEINDNPMRYTASYDEDLGKIVLTDRNGKTMELTVSTSSDMAGSNGVEEVKSKSTATYTAGQDAIMDVTINGVQFDSLTRSSNTFDLDGLTVTVKDTFSADDVEAGKDYDPVTFTSTTDTEKIIDAVRSFVNDYNEMITEIKNAYSTLPAQQTNGAKYEPLSDEEMEGMSESEIKAYEEQAKQGILFADSNLSSMYSKLLNAITPGGADGQILREIGIGTTYNSGLTTISLDEDKLRAALESDPDKVKNAFSKTREGGSSTDGLVKTMQNTLNTYVKTTGEPKGVLITRAGSIKAPTSLNSNSLQSQINSIDRQIDRWQTKMSKQIDRYTSQFSRLEQLIAEMNSQASAFAGLMGGDSGYGSYY